VLVATIGASASCRGCKRDNEVKVDLGILHDEAGTLRADRFESPAIAFRQGTILVRRSGERRLLSYGPAAAAPVVVEPELGRISQMVPIGDALYVTPDDGKAILRVVAGKAPEPVVQNLPFVHTLAGEQGGLVAVLDDASIVHYSLPSGTKTTIASGRGWVTELEVTKDRILWIESDADKPGPAVLFAAPRGGGAPVRLTPDKTNAYDFVVDGADLYWVDHDYDRRGPGRILKAPAQELARGDEDIMGFSADATHLYWIDRGLHAIRRVPKKRGPIATVASLGDTPIGYAVGAAPLFVWIEQLGAEMWTIDVREPNARPRKLPLPAAAQ
jgi:hypothetical protein